MTDRAAAHRSSAALDALARTLRGSTLGVADGTRGSGSGILWRDDGSIVTNAHVVRGSHAHAILGNDLRARATTVARDDDADLALLRIVRDDLALLERSGKRAAQQRDAASLRPGDLVFAMGYPLGLENALAGGVVERCNARWVVSDVKLAPGNSGGPLADAAGRVVGINSMVAGGRALAIPLERAAAFVAHATESRVPRRLGVTLHPLERGDLLVVGVADGSAADRSGIQLGDVLLASDRSPASDAARFAASLPLASRIDVRRGNESVTLELAWESPSTRAA
jgi:serine protease Do